MTSSDRYQAIEQSYYLSIRPRIQFLRQQISPDITLLDVGSGDGLISLKVANDLQARKIILVDNRNQPEVALPPHAEFHLTDIHSEELFYCRLRNQANFLFCLTAFHEFSEPLRAAYHLLMVLPLGGVALIMDYSEEGWEHQGIIAANGDAKCQAHFHEDQLRAWRFGLNTNVGIRQFWENTVFSRVPGICYLNFSGDAYNVLYQPRQWGEVKEPPPDIAPLVQSYRQRQ